MSVFRIILGSLIFLIVGILSLVYWHKKIDSESTWIYGIYVIIQIILWIFVLINLEQCWLTY